MASAVAARPRSTAVDVARGLAVVGVVFNHILIGLYLSDILTDLHSWLVWFNGALYLFRMAALALLLGLFIPNGIAKHGAAGYLRHRLPLLIWLYLIWQLGQGIIEVGASGVRNGATGWFDVLAVWLPLAQLWFLPFLAAATVLLTALRPWERTGRGRLGMAACLVLTVWLWGWVPNIAGVHGLALIGFVAVGAFIGLARMRDLLEGSPKVWLAVGLVSLALLVGVLQLPVEAGTIDNGGLDLPLQLTSVLGAALGVVLLLAVSAALARVPYLSRLLAYLGRHTLEIFLAHILVVATLRIVLQQKLDVDNVAVHICLGLVLGVALPLLAAAIAPRLRLNWFFDLPAWARRLFAPPAARRQAPAPADPATPTDPASPATLANDDVRT